MKSLLPALLLLTAGNAQAESIEALTARARDSVVVISHFGRQGKEEGLGAGFVISSNGLVATALHVIGEARPVSVRLANGKEYDATEIHAWDRKLDLAIIRLEAKGLSPLPLGDSDDLKQGASVIAIGNPLGLEHSVVQGVVSARRDFEFGEMIQLAIPIEAGNSGGPLLDLEGRVHGILTMKSSLSRNLGFAVPVNALKALLDRPNPVPITQWLTLGSLNRRQWTPLFDARWRQKNGQIHVEGMGKGFGGRSLCLSEAATPKAPFELGVAVRLDDESGAAGLVFGSDGGDKHFGFYPTAGQLRLTHFQGPNVFSWTILETLPSEHYRPGDWNHIKVRVEDDKLFCYVNEHLLIEAANVDIPEGKVGLAKFRDTRAAFKHFEVGLSVSPPAEEGNSLARQAEQLEQEAARLRRLASAQHRTNVQNELVRTLSDPEEKIDLFHAALLLAKLDDPEVDVAFYRRQLNSMADDLRAQLQKDTPAIDTLIKYLFTDNGFHGSRTDYYARANSHMNDVMDDREGLPIMLAVLFLELARRIDLPDVTAVAAPGHFMVKYKDQLIDVFNGGERISHNEAEQIIGAPLLDIYLKPPTKREIILRMLRNLQNSGSLADAARYRPLIEALSP